MPASFRGLFLVNFFCFLWLTEFERFLNRLRFHLLGKFAVTVVSEGKISKTTLPMCHWETVKSQCMCYIFCLKFFHFTVYSFTLL
jgi:hypothetical protein